MHIAGLRRGELVRPIPGRCTAWRSANLGSAAMLERPTSPAKADSGVEALESTSLVQSEPGQMGCTALYIGTGATVVLALAATILLITVGVSSTAAPGFFRNHIVLMPLAFVLLAPVGVISWRALRPLGLSREAIKATHALIMCAAATVAVVGVTHMYLAHEAIKDVEEPKFGQYHWESAHSWMGVVAVSLFVGNALGALLIFYNPMVDKGTRAAFLPVHVFSGIVAVLLTLFTVPMGIMSYAWRGTLEDSTIHPIPGGVTAALQYKASALLLIALLVAMLLVFFSSKPGWASATKL